MATPRYTFKKEERLCKQSHIDRLFSGPNDYSLKQFPLRMVVNFVAAEQNPCSKFLPVVPKRNVKKAVHRNYKKRLLKEAWRLNKHRIQPLLDSKQQDAHVVIFFNGNEDISFVELQQKLHGLVEQLLQNISVKTV